MNTQAIYSSSKAEMTLGRHCPLVTCGQEVKRGELIATTNADDKGDIHAPIPGKVIDVGRYSITIERREGETVAPVSLDGLYGLELQKKLREMGADLPLDEDVDTLILNAVDSEPKIFTRRDLLANFKETLETGARYLVEEAYRPRSTTLAVIKNTPQVLNKIKTKVISDQYPSGLDPLVAKAVTGTEAPESTLVVGLETVFHVGRIIETGLPVMETMITVAEKSQMVHLGTPVGVLLANAGESFHDRDRIVLGGFMRGTAAASPAQGVDRSTTAVTVETNPAPVAKDSACVGCGECVRRCPARLDPAMITSYAEFGMYDKAQAEHVEVCFECGLCGFFCLAQRPMLQYIRLAKTELAKAKAQTGEDN